MYDAGDGVKQDFTEAMRWYKLAAENGYAFAMYAIGDLYLAGEGVPEDAKTAAEWYQKASDNGEPNGHWALALRYLYGDGVTRDTTYAAELAYLALTNGLQVALDEFKAIDEADTPANFRRKLQQLLKDDGFYKGPIDGNFGPATIKAMEAAFDTVV
jgi:TPR repeat protein